MSERRYASRHHRDDVGGGDSQLEMFREYAARNPQLLRSPDFHPEMADYLIPTGLREQRPSVSIQKTSPGEFLVVDPNGRCTAREVADNFAFPESRKAILGERKGKQLSFDPLIYAQFSRLNGLPEALIVHTMDVSVALRGAGTGSEFQGRLATLARVLGFRQMVVTATDARSADFWRANGFVRATGVVLATLKERGLIAKGDNLIPLVKNLV
jgi:hypothetical protein